MRLSVAPPPTLESPARLPAERSRGWCGDPEAGGPDRGVRDARCRGRGVVRPSRARRVLGPSDQRPVPHRPLGCATRRRGGDPDLPLAHGHRRSGERCHPVQRRVDRRRTQRARRGRGSARASAFRPGGGRRGRRTAHAHRVDVAARRRRRRRAGAGSAGVVAGTGGDGVGDFTLFVPPLVFFAVGAVAAKRLGSFSRGLVVAAAVAVLSAVAMLPVAATEAAHLYAEAGVSPSSTANPCRSTRRPPPSSTPCTRCSSCSTSCSGSPASCSAPGWELAPTRSTRGPRREEWDQPSEGVNRQAVRASRSRRSPSSAWGT